MLDDEDVVGHGEAYRLLPWVDGRVTHGPHGPDRGWGGVDAWKLPGPLAKNQSARLTRTQTWDAVECLTVCPHPASCKAALRRWVKGNGNGLLNGHFHGVGFDGVRNVCMLAL